MNADLLAALALAPSLPGARCAGSLLWDPRADGDHPADLEYRLTAAARLCRTECPALAACESWFAALYPGDPTRPQGVVAGRFVGTGLTGRPPTWALSA